MTFSKKEAFALGWRRVTESFWPTVLIMIVAFAVLAVSGGVQKAVDENIGGPISFPVDLAVLVFQMFISLGLMKVYLAFADGGKRPEIQDLFSCGSLLWRYVGASIIYMLIVLGGLILLIVPGIVWAIKYRLYGYFILDKNADVMESIRLAGRASAGAKWNLFLFAILSGLISLAGLLVLGVGMLVAAPVIGIALAHVYRVLEKQIAEGKSDASDPAALPA